MTNIRKRPAGDAVQWITCGWNLFKSYMGLWVLITIAVMLLMILLGLLPLVGGIASALISPLLAAGMMNAADKIKSGETLDANHVLEPARSKKLNSLLILGVAQLLVAILSGLVAFSSLSPAVLEAMQTGGTSVNGPMGGLPITGVLLILTLWSLFFMALLYAPALVWFDDIKPTDALKQSFLATLRNWLPLSIYGLIMVVLAILSAFTFGLGYLMLLPVAYCSLYCSYRAIFHSEVKNRSAGVLES